MGAPQPDGARTADAGTRRLLDRIAHDAEPDGFVPFVRYMERALYDPDGGFYARPDPPFGRAGDFYTAAHVSPLFGAALANRVRSVRRAVGDVGPFRVVEIGPGDGTLAVAIARELEGGPVCDEYVLVERSAALRRRATERLRESVQIPVRVVESVAELGPFDGVVVANEVLDAQPARRLRWDGTAWRELGVRLARDRLDPAESPHPVGPLPREMPSVEAETVYEVAPGAASLVREVADHLERGLAIAIDYGMEESELLRAHPAGTLEAVRRHRFEGDPLAAPGATDLSTFVNFTRVRAAARAGGLREIAYTSQAEALGEWGFPALLDAAIRAAGSAEDEVRLRLAAKNLLFGFERFRVLELASPLAAAAVALAT